MSKKPTYEELELRIDELERKAFERKFSEEALQPSAGFLDALISSVSDGVIIYDDKFRYKLWNKFMEKLTGMRAENVLGKIAFDLFPHLREEGIDKLLERALAGETVQSDDTPYHVPDTGKVGWVTGVYSPHVDSSGNIVGVVAIVHDISDRKRAEEDLKKSEREKSAILDAMPELVAYQDTEHNILWTNQAAAESLDEDKENLKGRKCYKVWAGREDPCEVCPVSKAIETTKIQWSEITTYDERVWGITACPVKNETGEVIGVVEVAIDNTKRKRAEEALRAGEEKYRNIFENIQDVYYEITLDGTILEVSPSIEEISFYKREEIIGKLFSDIYVDPKKRNQLLKELLKNGKVDDYEILLKDKDDSRNYCSITAKLVFDKHGIPIKIIGSMRNIEERKQAEKELKKSEEKYRLLVESTPNWIWMCDLKSRFTFSNNSVKEILGYENHEILDISAFDLIHKEDRKSVQKWFQKAKKQKRGWRDSVIRWQHKDKSIRFLETIAEPILDGKDNLIGYLGIDRDVTDRKLSEIALQKAHNELQEKTKRLEIQKNSLEELNTAMKVLLKKREEDKTEIESNVLTNVKELIEPYFGKIKKTKLDDQQKALLSIMESNINEIVSPFTRKMSLKYLNLTPTEIQIANLIRHGNVTKEIAEIMKVSPRTIETHRKNIRRKIGLDRKGANLRSHLLSLL